MDFKKLYSSMTDEERLEWLQEFETFANASFSTKVNWDKETTEFFQKGLLLCTAFGYARPFVQQAMIFNDFPKRVNQTGYIIKKIKNDISRGQVTVTPSGERIAYASALQKIKKRGRPSKEENTENPDTATLCTTLIARITGATLVTKPTQRELNNSELQERKKQRDNSQSLFDMPSSPEKEDSPKDSVSQQKVSDETETTKGENDSDNKLSLKSLAPLLSPALQEKLKDIQSIRAAAASAAEKAKLLAEQKADADAIQPFATEATTKTEEYLAVYDEIDSELATLYLALTHYPSFVTDIQKKLKAIQKDSIEELQQLLLPYYTKMSKYPEFEPSALDFIAKNTPEAKLSQLHEKERKKKVAALLKYIKRTDVPPSAKRAKGLRRALEDLSALGEDTAPYMPYLQTVMDAIHDNRKNNN